MGYYDSRGHWHNNNDVQQQITNQQIQHSDMMELLRSQKEEDRIRQLEIEIIKATDPNIKSQLEELLDEEIESIRIRKRNKWIVAVVSLVVGLGLLLLLFKYVFQDDLSGTTISKDVLNTALQEDIIPNESTGDSTTPIESTDENVVSTKPSNSENASNNANDVQEIDTTNLTEQQVADWVLFHFADICGTYLALDDFGVVNGVNTDPYEERPYGAYTTQFDNNGELHVFIDLGAHSVAYRIGGDGYLYEINQNYRDSGEVLIATY